MDGSKNCSKLRICVSSTLFNKQRDFMSRSFPIQAFSLTPRFSGFPRTMKTAEAVPACRHGEITPLKRGVNERDRLGVPMLIKRAKLTPAC